MSDHTISIYMDGDELRIRVDAPGVAAVSAPVADPFAFCATLAQEAGLEVVVDQAAGTLTIYRTPATNPDTE